MSSKSSSATINSSVKSGIVYVASSALYALTPFLLLPILTSFLTTEEFGKISVFQSLLGLLSAFIGLNTHGAASRVYYQEEINKSEYINACLFISISSFIIYTIAINMAGTYISAFLGLPLLWIYLGGVVSFGTALQMLLLGQLQVRGKALQYGAIQVSFGLLNLLLAVIMVVVMQKGANGRVIAQSMAALMLCIVSLILLYHHKYVQSLKVRIIDLLDALKYGLYLIPHVAGGFLILSADRIIISNELGLSQAGIYSVAFQVAMVLQFLYEALNKAYVPWLFERLANGKDSDNTKVVRMTYKMIITNIVLVALYCIIAPNIISAVAGESYIDASKYVIYIIVGQGFGGLYFLVTNYLFYQKKTGTLSLITITTGIINVLLMMLLIPKYSLLGVSVAFMISMMLRFFATWFYANKYYPMPWFVKIIE